MKTYLNFFCITFFLLLISTFSFGQSENKPYFEIRIGYMPTLGNVNTQGENTPWINTLSSDGNQNINGDTFSSTTIGIGYGKYMSPQLRLGLGVDVDFYNNISEGHTSRTVPFFGDVKYILKSTKRGLFVYGQTGYSFITGMDWHTGFKGGFGIGYSMLSSTSERGFNFSIGYNYQVLNKLSQQILGPPVKGEGLYGPTTVRYLSFAGYKNIIIQTLPIKITYEF